MFYIFILSTAISTYAEPQRHIRYAGWIPARHFERYVRLYHPDELVICYRQENTDGEESQANIRAIHLSLCHTNRVFW